jgi:uncharacterized protein YecT (DUF1311 family)
MTSMRVTSALLAIVFLCSLKALCQSDTAQDGASANREYAAVFARSENPCSADYATVPYVQCMDKELAFVQQHLDAFVEDLRKIVTSPEELASLNRADTAWRTYRESICALPYKRFADGTAKAPMSAECQWNQDRAYMKQLNGLYILSQFPK